METLEALQGTDKLCRIWTPDGWQTIIVRPATDNLAPPVLSYMRNWTLHQVNQFCLQQRWDFVVLAEVNAAGMVEDLRRWNVI